MFWNEKEECMPPAERGKREVTVRKAVASGKKVYENVPFIENG